MHWISRTVIEEDFLGFFFFFPLHKRKQKSVTAIAACRTISLMIPLLGHNYPKYFLEQPVVIRNSSSFIVCVAVVLPLPSTSFNVLTLLSLSFSLCIICHFDIASEYAECWLWSFLRMCCASSFSCTVLPLFLLSNRMLTYFIEWSGLKRTIMTI